MNAENLSALNDQIDTEICGEPEMVAPVSHKIIRELEIELSTLRAELAAVKAAIVKHHDQKADDRCWLDDDDLYEAAGLPPVDRRVGDKEAMLANCPRFIDKRCEGGHWPSYVELEADRDDWRDIAVGLRDFGGPPLPKHQRQFGEVLARYLEKLRKEGA